MSASTPPLKLVEASLEDLQTALSQGRITSVDLAARYLRRISAYDCRGPALNAIPVLNQEIFDEAAASDDRRARGQPPRPLDGIPFTAKDNFKVTGQPTAAGSPEFLQFIANEDAQLVRAVREAGGVLVGRTNMPAAANGGMQRGIYGRAENPYNPEYLAAAFASGSSNGSGVSTAASMASFGLGSETVSSGRSPASNNGLIAYTPSKGWLSCRGLCPLYLTCDVPVPHTRTMRDMLALLDVLRQPADTDQDDFWRTQTFVKLVNPWASAPASLTSLLPQSQRTDKPLVGLKIAVPEIYVGGPTPEGAKAVTCAPSVISLWRKAEADLKALGADIKYTPDLPAVTKYENPDLLPEDCPRLPQNWVMAERGKLCAHGWNDFIKSFQDPQRPDIQAIDPVNIYPVSMRTEPEMRHFDHSNGIHYHKLKEYAQHGTVHTVDQLDEAVKTLEDMRRILFEDWLDSIDCHCVVFPAAGDVGPANADSDFGGAADAWRNGVHYSTGNRAIRHLGIPTVSVPMGLLEDKGVPMNLTFAGKAFEDIKLLQWAAAYESVTNHRVPPEHTPDLDSDVVDVASLYPSGVQEAWPRPTLTVHTYTTETSTVKPETLHIFIGGSISFPSRGTSVSPVLDITIDATPVSAREIVIAKAESRPEGEETYAFEVNTTASKPIEIKGLGATLAPVARDKTMCVLVARAMPHGRPTGWIGLI